MRPGKVPDTPYVSRQHGEGESMLTATEGSDYLRSTPARLSELTQLPASEAEERSAPAASSATSGVPDWLSHYGAPAQSGRREGASAALEAALRAKAAAAKQLLARARPGPPARAARAQLVRQTALLRMATHGTEAAEQHRRYQMGQLWAQGETADATL